MENANEKTIRLTDEQVLALVRRCLGTLNDDCPADCPLIAETHCVTMRDKIIAERMESLMKRARPMTNLEWIKTLDAGEMAEFMQKVENMSYEYRICEHCQNFDAENDECKKNYDCDFDFKDWLNWPHE